MDRSNHSEIFRGFKRQPRSLKPDLELVARERAERQAAREAARKVVELEQAAAGKEPAPKNTELVTRCVGSRVLLATGESIPWQRVEAPVSQPTEEPLAG